MRKAWITAALCLVACEERAPTKATPTPPAKPLEERPAPSAPKPVEKPEAPSLATAQVPLTKGLEINVPAGVLRIGSPTGSAYRDASHEADDVALEMPAFAIDALPYPNDPAEPFQKAVDRAEAARLCGAVGKRLCSELEWERACKGDENVEYPSFGAALDVAACKADPQRCRSPFGVASLGVTAREWTSSDVTRGLGDSLRSAVVRGAAADAPLAQHRCAARDAATPNSKSDSLVFRCCRGETTKLSYPVEPAVEPFRDASKAGIDARNVLKSIPALADIADSFRPFSEREIDEGFKAAGSSRARVAPWTLAPASFLWSPVHGEVVLVLSGDTPRGALVAAIYPLPEQRYVLIGSFETKDEHLPIVVAYKTDAPRELLFSSCWGCGGEGGAIAIGEDARISFQTR